jgi:DNA-binding NtrC family response regulator
VGQGGFRRDFYFRISTIVLTIPPLRERGDDIPLLARQVLARCAAGLGRPEVRLGAGAEAALRGHAWPGNIRELRNVLERTVLLSPRAVLGPEDFRFDPSLSPGEGPEPEHLSLREVERRHIERVLRAEGGRVARAAKRLGVPKSTLYQKIRSHGITLPRA